MSFIIDLLLLLLVIVWLPYIVVGAIIGKLLAEVGALFHLSLLFPAVSAAGLAGLTWLNSTPDESTPWTTLLESFSQGHLLGISTPAWCAGLGVALFVAAGSKTWYRPSRRADNA